MKETTPRCQEWLPRKGRRCAALALPHLPYCGNHKPSDVEQRIPCPVDPSHTILESEAQVHARRCPGLVRLQQLECMPYYHRGLNVGSDDDLDNGVYTNGLAQENRDVAHGQCTSKLKRAMFNSLSQEEFSELVRKIELAYEAHCSHQFSLGFEHPTMCNKWATAELDRRIPFQEKHVVQQASMLGNMENFGLLPCLELDAAIKGGEERREEANGGPVVLEFGAGRGYLSHMLADCYGARKIILVERRSYKFKADRTLRQYAAVTVERVRIDIEDLDLCGVGSLEDSHYVAVSKHLCGYATDLALRCCTAGSSPKAGQLDGIAIATCCHHLCRWKPYVNKAFFKQLGFTRRDFHILTWLTSGAVSGTKKQLSNDQEESHLMVEPLLPAKICSNKEISDTEGEMVACPADRATLGFKCKRLLDVGRLYWLRQLGMNAKLVAYVPREVTPENILLLAKAGNGLC